MINLLLLPRLPAPAAERLLEKYLRNTPHKWPGFDSNNLPESVRFTPTGGSPISPKHLDNIRANILRIAKANGYGGKGTRNELSSFDSQTAAWLADQPVFASGEALRDDTWAFIAIIVAPDIVSWRFGDSPERYLGGVRNTFQRLWLRGKSFDRGKTNQNRWDLLEKLTEDAFVQITERPSLGGNPVLALAIAEAWVRASLHYGKGVMETLTRRAVLEIRARNEVRCLDELSAESLAAVLDTIFKTPVAIKKERQEEINPSDEKEEIEKSKHPIFNGVTGEELIFASMRLLEEAKRWHLLSPKSTTAIQALLALNPTLTSNERNALNHLITRIESIGLLEQETKTISLAINKT